MSDEQVYAKARKRAESKYAFFIHCAVYTAVMLLLVVINLVTSPQELWFIWPLIGWGFAVALHGVRVFLLGDKNAIIDAMTENKMRQSTQGKPFGRR